MNIAYWAAAIKNGQFSHRLLEKTVRALQLLPYFTTDSNKPATARVIRLIKELGITPKAMVDIGANESQWAAWLVNEWPGLYVTSFEPLERFTPLGAVFRIALSDRTGGMLNMVEDGEGSRLAPEGTHSVPVSRLDDLPHFYFPKPAILKVDAENFTARALRGCGLRINEFAVVVVEMWNDRFNGNFVDQQAAIWGFMLENGFRHARVVEARWEVDMITQYDIAFWK